MFCTIKVKLEYLIPLFCLSLAAVSVLIFGGDKGLEVASVQRDNYLIIDPGHGGIDGGALSVSGDKESDINLDIAKKLSLIATLYGENVLLTRENDLARTDAKSYSEREDLMHRTEIVNSVPNAVLISIHQNCYPTSQPSGAQVLYANNDLSRQFGEISHENIIHFLQPENRRVAEPAPKKLYITSNAKCPTILVECGFMSNLSDLTKLKDAVYQTALSSVLFASYLQFRYP